MSLTDLLPGKELVRQAVKPAAEALADAPRVATVAPPLAPLRQLQQSAGNRYLAGRLATAEAAARPPALTVAISIQYEVEVPLPEPFEPAAPVTPAGEGGAVEEPAAPAEESPPEAAPSPMEGEKPGAAKVALPREGAPSPEVAPTAEGAAPAPAAAPAAEGGEGDIPLLMPEPPTELSPEAQKRVEKSQKTMRRAGAVTRKMPDAEASKSAAQGAVKEPQEETRGRAELGLATMYVKKADPSPELVALCDEIRSAIREKRPLKEDELVNAKPDEMAAQTGNALNSQVEGDAQRVQGSYDEMNHPPEGEAALKPTGIDSPPAAVGTPDPNASAALPEAIPPENVSLDADVAQADQRIEEAGMNRETAKLVQEGPIAEARQARGELGEAAQQSPAAVLAKQDAALEQARGNLGALQEQALAALADSRAGTVGGVRKQQDAMVGTEEQMRQALSQRANTIFNDAQKCVNEQIGGLTKTAMAMWKEGINRHSLEFRQHLNRVKSWIEDRHSGVGGFFAGAWDWATGLPDWVTEEYDAAEKKFGDDICNLILEISSTVNTIVAACEGIIAEARRQIDDLYTNNLPEELRTWAEGERKKFGSQLNGLEKKVHTTRDRFNQDMARQAVTAVKQVQEEVNALREAAKGMIGRIADAIAAFIDDPIRAIINGLLSLVGISPAAFWALIDKIAAVIDMIADDPMTFLDNLVSALSKGFQLFFDNIWKHLIRGLLEWLFSGMPAGSITVPTDFSLKSIITFFLQIMGITWPRIRKILVRHIGEENVALIEKAWSLISTLIEKGPEGVFDMIRERLDPQEIFDQVMDAAIQYVVETVIKNVTLRIIGLFNPASAIVQAIELIYKLCKWIFENAARIFTFVETIVNGVADLLAGNIGGMAKAVEAALAKLIPPVIDFLAELVGLGDLPEKVAEIIKKLQAWVESIIEKIIVWLVERGRKLLAALGLDKKKDDQPGAGDTDLGTSVAFSAAGESHRQWIKVAGSDAVLMVASDAPKTVEQKLNEWEGKLGKQFGKDEEKRTQAAGLIAEARSLAGEAETQADQLAPEFQKAKSAPAPAEGEAAPATPSDDELEAEQRSLADVLVELFKLFGEKGVKFETVDVSAPMDGGAESVQVTAAEEHPAVTIAGESGAQSLESILPGPLGQGKNASGLNLARQVAGAVKPRVAKISKVPLLGGTIQPEAQEGVRADAEAIAGQISKLGPAMKIPSLERARRIDAMADQGITFEYNPARNQKYKNLFLEQLESQLLHQQNGLNELTIDSWTINVNVYRMNEDDYNKLDKSARQAVLEVLNERAKEAAETARTKEKQYLAAMKEIKAALAADRVPKASAIEVVTGRFGDETAWREKHREGLEALYDRFVEGDKRWKKIAKDTGYMAVLHNPDQVAGGPGEIPEIDIPPSSDDEAAWEAYLDKLTQFIGAKRVNSAIGSAWGRKIDDVYKSVTGAYKQPGWPIWRLNFKFNTAEKSA